MLLRNGLLMCCRLSWSHASQLCSTFCDAHIFTFLRYVLGACARNTRMYPNAGAQSAGVLPSEVAIGRLQASHGRQRGKMATVDSAGLSMCALKRRYSTDVPRKPHTWTHKQATYAFQLYLATLNVR